MPKPIAVLYIPKDGNWAPAHQLMADMNGWETPERRLRMIQPEDFKDYLWLVFHKRSIEEPQLRVFYEKDFTEIQFEELKSMIMKFLQDEEHPAYHMGDASEKPGSVQSEEHPQGRGNRLQEES